MEDLCCPSRLVTVLKAQTSIVRKITFSPFRLALSFVSRITQIASGAIVILARSKEEKEEAVTSSASMEGSTMVSLNLHQQSAPSFSSMNSLNRCKQWRFHQGFSAVARVFASMPAVTSRRRNLITLSKVACNSSRTTSLNSVAPISSDEDVSGGRPWKTSDARLVLEDGSIWRAKSFGATGTQVGEVVFNTSLTGYQEILTDPSYAGQFVLMTNPHIGNTGVNPDDEESSKCFLGGLIIRSLSICTSNWRCTASLGDYLAKRNIMGIYDVDTRAITRRLREEGSLIGVLSTDESKTDEELLELSRQWKIVGVDLISGVSCSAPYEWTGKTDSSWEFNTDMSVTRNFHVVAYDFGIKHNILRRLASYGCKITVVPSSWPSSETLKMNPDGVFFSNGPGDPAAVPYAVDIVKEIIGKVPVFGICMGHQLIGQALGGETFKMKFGHHGGNHPVCFLRNGRVEISAQNHNYAVDPASLPAGVEVTHVNLNDNSCAGLACPELKLMSLQYHPESSPGPHDSDTAFEEFILLMEQSKQSV